MDTTEGIRPPLCIYHFKLNEKSCLHDFSYAFLVQLVEREMLNVSPLFKKRREHIYAFLVALVQPEMLIVDQILYESTHAFLGINVSRERVEF